MIRRLLTFAFIVTLFHQAVAQQVNTKRLDSLLYLFSDNNKAMGSITLIKNGRTIYTKAFGYGSYDLIKRDGQTVGDKVQLLNNETAFRIGSITKMFTASMIMQLVEEKKLTLNEKLSTFFPKLPNADKITIDMLLRHRSGLHNVTDDEDYLKWAVKEQTHDEMLKRFETTKPDFDPDTKAQYSNTNFILLGYIIEKITGKTYAENLQSRIAKPLNLTRTYVGGKIDAAKNEAASFDFENDSWKTSDETDMSIPGGAGSIVSTPRDLGVFISALFNGKVVSEASLKEMITMKDNYGMGLRELPFNEKTTYGHGGAIDGFHSMLSYFPEDSLAIAATFNGVNYNTNEILIDVLSIYFNQPYEFPSFTTIELSDAQLKRYEGEYSSKEMPLKITIKREGNHLTAQATGQSSFPLDAVSETEFKFDQAGVVMIFELAKKGKVQTFTLRQRGRSFVYTRDK